MTSIRSTHIFALLGILFLALNLRGPFTSLAPVLAQIMENLHLTASAAGMLTALPLLTFALISPFVTKLSQRLGLEPSLFLALFLITAGIVLRSWGSVNLLYLGTILIGVGIAIGNVLLPVVVKINFPERIAMVTSLYIFTMGIGSTLSSSLMVPLSNQVWFSLSGWQLALFLNLLFPLLALAVWLPKLKKRASKVTIGQGNENKVSIKKLLVSPIAWQVTLTLGLNSFTFYSFAGWLPKILSDLSFSEVDAGYIYGLLQFSTMLPGLLLLPLLGKKNNQQLLILLCALSVVVAALGLLYFPDAAIFWVVLFGVGNCSTFIISLAFIGLRTSSGNQAVALSGMSQGIGYGLAATGPGLVGWVHNLSDAWEIPLFLIAGVALLCTGSAVLASRDKVIDA